MMNTTTKVPLRQRLSAARMRHRWTQQEVADRLGTTPGNVSRWERGITSPGPYFRSKLCELFGSSAKDLGLTWDESDDAPGHNLHASSSEATFLWNAPPRSTPFFTGHEDLLAQLHALLRPNTTLLPSIRASSGSGVPNLPEQEDSDQEQLAQIVMQWLQTHPNWMLLLDNAQAVVLVAPNNEQHRLFTTLISEATALLLFLALVGRQRQLQV